MPKYTSPLEGVRVAAPCPADWDRMVGDERARFCDRCSLHVYNLSGMTRREAEALVTNAEGRLCVRYYSRPDGTILTQDCPVGLRAIRQKVTRVAGAFLSAVLGFFTGVGLDLGFGRAAHRATTGAAVAKFPGPEKSLVPPTPGVDGPPVEYLPVMGGIDVPEPRRGRNPARRPGRAR